MAQASMSEGSVGARSWPYAALLWLQAWLHNATFMHIPKTGGSALEHIDLSAPLHQLALYSVAAGINHRFTALQMLSGYPALSGYRRAPRCTKLKLSLFRRRRRGNATEVALACGCDDIA